MGTRVKIEIDVTEKQIMSVEFGEDFATLSFKNGIPLDRLDQVTKMVTASFGGNLTGPNTKKFVLPETEEPGPIEHIYGMCDNIPKDNKSSKPDDKRGKKSFNYVCLSKLKDGGPSLFKVSSLIADACKVSPTSSIPREDVYDIVLNFLREQSSADNKDYINCRLSTKGALRRYIRNMMYRAVDYYNEIIQDVNYKLDYTPDSVVFVKKVQS